MKPFSAFLLLLAPVGSLAQEEMETWATGPSNPTWPPLATRQEFMVGIVQDGTQQFSSYGETAKGR